MRVIYERYIGMSAGSCQTYILLRLVLAARVGILAPAEGIDNRFLNATDNRGQTVVVKEGAMRSRSVYCLLLTASTVVFHHIA